MKSLSVVFIDLDGTLLRKDKTISERSRRVLRRCKELGISVVIASARPERVITIYEELKDADALITLNGARVRIGDKVFHNGLRREDGLALLEQYLRYEDLCVTLETSDGIHGNVTIPEWNVVGQSDLVSVLDTRDLYKILISAKKRDEKIEERICGVIEMLRLTDQAYYSVSEGWLYQIMSKRATKWNAAKLVLGMLGKTPRDAVYFGDDNDDFECIDNMGRGIAMGNSIQRILEAADEIAPTNEEDGVAVILERLLS